MKHRCLTTRARPPRRDAFGRLCLALAAALVLLVFGCDSRSAPSADSGTTRVDSAAQVDRGAPPRDGSVVIGRWRFTPEPPPPDFDERIMLALDKVDGDRVTLSVRVRQIQLQGIAFRLAFEPGLVTVVSHERGSGWGSHPLVERFAVKQGALWAGIGYIGQRGVPGEERFVAATITLKISSDQPVKLAFVPGRNAVLQPKPGAFALPVAWLGGTLSPR